MKEFALGLTVASGIALVLAAMSEASHLLLPLLAIFGACAVIAHILPWGLAQAAPPSADTDTLPGLEEKPKAPRLDIKV
jgi:hypothetical protein